MSNIYTDLLPEDYAWLGFEGDELKKFLPTVVNPLAYKNIPPEYHDNFSEYYAKTLRSPDYFASICRHIFDIELLPIQDAILRELWTKPFPMLLMTRGGGKSWILALYATLRCFLIPETKIIIAGAAFRQSKIIFEYMVNIWDKAPVFRSLVGNKGKPRFDTDRCKMSILDSWAIAIPIGTGDKIRGLRAHTIICDEFAAVNPSIYETVISGFSSVSKDPADNVKLEHRKKYLIKNNMLNGELEKLMSQKQQVNQSIIAGTADYGFKHFAQYFKRYHKIIESKGDINMLKEYFGDSEENSEAIKAGANWKDYSIMRVPYELMPDGFMDSKTVMRAKATIHSAIYQMEYGCCFVEDSQGFFKRTLIESCVTTNKKPIEKAGGLVNFQPLVIGNAKKRYVYGIDPAAEKDNFTIVILELYEDHYRIVNVWATNRKKFQAEKKHGSTDENDFYVYCARKIRNLMEVFPCARIGLDSQGGGRTIEQSLHSKNNLKPGEQMIWEIVDKDDRKPTDKEPGLHIVEMINFADAQWTSAANHGLRLAFEQQKVLFPEFDNVALANAIQQDKVTEIARAQADAANFEDRAMFINYNSFEDAAMEIEELKNELSTIEMTTTLNGRDRWDTPEIVENGHKSKLHKDRYSALLMAYMMAEQITNITPAKFGSVVGRLASDAVKKRKKGASIEDIYSFVRRSV